MAKITFDREVDQFKEYLKSDSNEDARRPLLYPLFQKLFKDKFKIESDASGADVYVEGTVVVEAKTLHTQWLEGFYQALHYHKYGGLAYNTVMVVARQFVGIWHVKKLPEAAFLYYHGADAHKAPNEVGRENARKTGKDLKMQIRQAALYWLEPNDLEGDIFSGAKSLTTETYEILKILNNLDSDRIQINTHNFIQTIEAMKAFFPPETPIEAVHGFYTMVAYWDITATVATNDDSQEVRIVGFKGQKLSNPVHLAPKKVADFKRFVENRYIFTNEGSGLTVDYYFSRFDEVLAIIDRRCCSALEAGFAVFEP